MMELSKTVRFRHLEQANNHIFLRKQENNHYHHPWRNSSPQGKGDNLSALSQHQSTALAKSPVLAKYFIFKTLTFTFAYTYLNWTSFTFKTNYYLHISYFFYLNWAHKWRGTVVTLASFSLCLSRNSSLISSSVTQSSKIPQRTERDFNDEIQVKNVELNYSLAILHIFSIRSFARNLPSPPSNSSIHKECPSKPVPMNNNITLITKSFTPKRGESMLEITGMSRIASN